MLLKLFFRLNTFVLKTLAAHRLTYYKHLYPGILCVGHNIRFGKGSSIVVANPTASAMLRIGSGSAFRQRCVLTLEEEGALTIGANNFFNNNCSISCLGQITIGNDNLFGENVKLYDHNHEFRNADRLVRDQGFNVGKIIIGDNCWFGSNCVILNNVIVGDNVVVGANVVVYKSIPANSLVRLESTITVRPLTRPTSSAD